ncbi:MAG: methyltransferase domain-containing protein [Terricaulis sp.]
MRASMAANSNASPSCHAEQWANPTGLAGMAALTAMALTNGRQNKAALDALDVKAGDVVLEIGCGPGMGLRRARDLVGRTGFVAGVDRSGCAVHTAAHAVHRSILRGRAAVMHAEAHDLPFRDLMFDKAFAVNSYQFWPDPARAVREIARVLAPRGRFVITQRAEREGGRTDFPGAAGGMERITRAVALLKSQGWNIIDEHCVPDGARLLAVSVTALRPD